VALVATPGERLQSTPRDQRAFPWLASRALGGPRYEGRQSGCFEMPNRVRNPRPQVPPHRWSGEPDSVRRPFFTDDFTPN
jgi:hypothetical protein